MRERMIQWGRKLAVLMVIAGLTMLVGCGTTAVVHKPAESKSVFDRYQALAIKSTSAQGVVVSDAAQARIKDLVKTNIECKYCPKRFRTISTKEAAQDDLVLLINYTTYDEGSRFGRLLLAGIGGIKIHSDVMIKTAALEDPLSSAEVGKTFRWGGIYGAMTSIDDVEKWFAEEIAKTFAGMVGVAKLE